jgi:glycosyltransferase involved in cell wall biosynthesis
MNNGSKLRIYNLLRGLSKHHDVTLISFIDRVGANIEVSELRDIISDVKVIPWRKFNPKTLRARLGMFSLKPRSIVDTFSNEMANAITEALNNQIYDLVIASQLQMAAYYPYFRNTLSVFEEFEIGLFYDRAFSPDRKIRFRHALTWFKLRIYLSRLLNSFQACTVVSEKERQLVVHNFPGYNRTIEIIPNCLNIDEYKDIKTDKKSNTLIFTGSFKYHANYDAMLWFVDKVFPLILKRMPDTQLIITGDHANLPLPSYKNITLTGFVDDFKGLLASSTVCIAPLLSGGGTRIKILEAMALKIPVVATSKGAEGLNANDGEQFLLANSPVEFAECVIKLLSNKDLRLKLAEKANLLVKEKYNWGIAMLDYSRLIQILVSRY